jgi:CBS domain-containing membrane protein
MRVGALVTRGVRSVLPDEPASAVARIMMEGRCDAVPVVTAAGILLGLVTATDLVAALARGAAAAPAGSLPGTARVSSGPDRSGPSRSRSGQL